MKYYLSIFCSLLLIACGKENPSTDSRDQTSLNGKAITVRLAQVQKENINLSIGAIGQVTSENDARPAFKTGGVIAKMYAEEGSFVNKGQLLATLDLTEIDAQVQQATVAVEKSNRDLQRAENLYADSVATLENVQDARTGLRVAEENLKMAQFNKSYSEIRSPIAGKVIQKLVNTGEIVGPGMPAYYILGNTKSDWVIKSGLSDRDWARVNKGDQARVSFDAYPGKNYKAKVTQLADTGNPGSGTFDVEFVLLESPPRLAAGLLASIEIFPENVDNQVVIPLDALVETNRFDAKVFTVEAETASEVTVKIAFLHEDKVVISAGLEGVENVVTDGAPYLYEGAKVEVVE
ncbi:MAG: efflux RND transporter periplasmic adaptor subunit [Bacteroidota bacterium]